MLKVSRGYLDSYWNHCKITILSFGSRPYVGHFCSKCPTFILQWFRYESRYLLETFSICSSHVCAKLTTKFLLLLNQPASNGPFWPKFWTALATAFVDIFGICYHQKLPFLFQNDHRNEFLRKRKTQNFWPLKWDLNLCSSAFKQKRSWGTYQLNHLSYSDIMFINWILCFKKKKIENSMNQHEIKGFNAWNYRF